MDLEEDEWDQVDEYVYDYEEEECGEMYLKYHAGKCCGVKTIEGFSVGPESHVFALPEYVPNGTLPVGEGMPDYDRHPSWDGKAVINNYDKYGYHITSADRFYTQERPKEKAIERLNVYLDFLRKERPSGMVDCYLIDWMVAEWDETLKGLGFKVACRFRNSNSGNYITCYQLCYGQPEEKKTSKKKAVAAPFAPVLS